MIETVPRKAGLIFGLCIFPGDICPTYKNSDIFYQSLSLGTIFHTCDNCLAQVVGIPVGRHSGG